MTTLATGPAALDVEVKLPGAPDMLSHMAFVTHDVEATVNFYENILGMPLCSTVFGDQVPSTGADFPYFHLFFRMNDGSTVAFFESPAVPLPKSKGHPAYELFDHLAFEVDGRAKVDQWHAWLVSHDIDVVGPTDHKIIYSIYFYDPNGHRLEITTPLTPDWNHHDEKAHQDLAGWLAAKKEAEESGEDVSTALIRFIRRVKSEATPSDLELEPSE